MILKARHGVLDQAEDALHLHVLQAAPQVVNCSQVLPQGDTAGLTVTMRTLNLWVYVLNLLDYPCFVNMDKVLPHVVFPDELGTYFTGNFHSRLSFVMLKFLLGVFRYWHRYLRTERP